MYFGSGIVSIIGPAFAYIPVITASLGKMMAQGQSFDHAWGRLAGTIMAVAPVQVRSKNPSQFRVRWVVSRIAIRSLTPSGLPFVMPSRLRRPLLSHHVSSSRDRPLQHCADVLRHHPPPGHAEAVSHHHRRRCGAAHRCVLRFPRLHMPALTQACSAATLSLPYMCSCNMLSCSVTLWLHIESQSACCSGINIAGSGFQYWGGGVFCAQHIGGLPPQQIACQVPVPPANTTFVTGECYAPAVRISWRLADSL